MTSPPLEETEAAAGTPPGPPALALVAAQELVTRQRLRLTDPADRRLGPLGGDEYVLGAAAWTGRVAAFVGFYVPPAVGAGEDLARRVEAASAWALERVRTQGLSGAERGVVLLVALGSVAAVPLPPQPAGPVRVGALAVAADGSVAALLPSPSGLPGAGDARRWAQEARDPGRVPTLAAVDLVERQTVQGGYAAPVRTAMTVTRPLVAYGLIAAFVLVYVVQKATDRRVGLSTDVPVYDAGALVVLGAHAADLWRYVSYGFIHEDSNLAHILFNSLAMLWIGATVERLYGRTVLLGTFLGAVVGSALFLLVATRVGVDTGGGAVGASGGIAGLVGLLLMLGRVQGRDVPAGLAASLRQYAVLVIVINIVFGLTDRNISNTGHLGGLLTGALIACVLPPLPAVGGRPLRRVEQVAVVVLVAAAAVAILVFAVKLADVLSSPAAAATGL